LGDYRLHDLEGMLVAVGEAVDDTGKAGVGIAAAEILRRDDLTGGGGTTAGRRGRSRPGCARSRSRRSSRGVGAPKFLEPSTAAICGIPRDDIRAWL
jgi:hypothetical protein